MSNNVIVKNTVRKEMGDHCKAFIKRLLERKSMNQLQTEIAIQNELWRVLNCVQLTAIGLGGIIGAGIIVLVGQAAALHAGPSVIISFIIAGFIALLAGFSFSELAAMMSHSGAAYTYTYAALGEYAAWFIGWNYALLYQLAILTVVVNWSKYVVHLIHIISGYDVKRALVEPPVAWNETELHFFTTGQVINLPAIVLGIGITCLLISGIRPTAIVNLVLVVCKIIILLIFIFACCKYVNRDNYLSFFPPNQGSFSAYGFTGMLKACTSVFFAYIGFESITTVAQEAKAPTARSIPFAIIASIIISLLIYIGITTTMIGLVPHKLLETDHPLSTAIKATPHGIWLPILVNLGAIAALTTVALTTLLSQTRIFYAMATDGLLPSCFASIRNHIPWLNIIISGTFCTVIAGVFPVDIVGETSSISALITYLFVHIEVIVMRYTHKEMQRIFVVPFGPWLVPTLGGILCILLMTGISKGSAYRFLVWTAIGQIIYFTYGYWHSRRRPKRRDSSPNGSIEAPSMMESIVLAHMDRKSEPNTVNEIFDDESDDIILQYL